MRWAEVCWFLRDVQVPQVLAFALMVHRSAWTRRLLEFSIPEFVRAAEGVIALAKGEGAKVFENRARRLVPSLAQDDYVGRDLDRLLPDLYQLRSDCVHGKLPFEDLKAQGPEGWETACQLAYLAEVLAREALLVALRRPDRTVFETRDALAGAWASGAFPASAAAG
jgi:hypothetical protein